MTATQITAATRLIVQGRSGGICEVCAQARATEMSHRRPRGMGGTSIKARHTPAGLLHLCHGCHQGPRGVESDRARARDNGWLIGPLEDPALVPVRLRTLYGDGWWLLDDSGSYTSASPLAPAAGGVGTPTFG